MSDVEAKPEPVGGNAIQRLSDLRTRWGAEVAEWKVAPELVIVNSLRRETWRRFGSETRLNEVRYELIESVAP